MARVKIIGVMVVICAALLSINAECQERRPRLEVATKSTRVLSFTFTDITPSFMGTACLSLTKKPTKDVSEIIWNKIRLSDYSEEALRLSEILFTGRPLRYRYPGYVNEFLFFPVRVRTTDGRSEDWYLQGEVLVGFLTDGNKSKNVEVLLSSVKKMRFLGLSTERFQE